jgi:ribose transport system ATP-binding protein
MVIDGETVFIHSPSDANALGIVLVHQHLSLIPELSVWENINLGHETRKKGVFADNRVAKSKAQQILEELIPGELSIEAKVVDLTPEQKQMVEIAKALSQNPKLLILDEPTAALEYFHVEKLFKKVTELKETGVSIIFISHRLWEITKLCDIVFAFGNGETVGMVDFETSPRDENLIVPLVTGSKQGVEEQLRRDRRRFETSETALELQNVCYGSKLKNINLRVKRGEVLGVGGLAGQGQEELVLLLSGALRPTEGNISIDGSEVRANHPKTVIRDDIFLVPGDRQRDGLFMNHSVVDNVMYPRFAKKDDNFILNFEKMATIARNVTEKVDMQPPGIKNSVSNLSGGNQQKVVFAKWFQFDPKILLLNDPAKGIDIQAKNALYRLVHELTESGTTVVLYASANEELVYNCDRVIIMFEGQIVDELAYDDICDEKLITSSLRVGSSE